jgi:hypothetical protein
MINFTIRHFFQIFKKSFFSLQKTKNLYSFKIYFSIGEIRVSRANKIRLLNIVISILLLLALNFVVPVVLAGPEIPGGGIPK